MKGKNIKPGPVPFRWPIPQEISISFPSLHPGSGYSPGHRSGVCSGLPAIPPGQWHQDQRSEARRIQWLLGKSGALQRRSGPLLWLPEHPRCKRSDRGYMLWHLLWTSDARCTVHNLTETLSAQYEEIQMIDNKAIIDKHPMEWGLKTNAQTADVEQESRYEM